MKLRIITSFKGHGRRHVGNMKPVVINVTVCLYAVYLHNTDTEFPFCSGVSIVICRAIFIIGFGRFVCVVLSVNCNRKSDAEFEM